MNVETIRSYIKEQVAYLKEYKVQPSDIADDQPLFSDEDEVVDNSLDLDSLDAVELALAIEEEYKLETPEDIDIRRFRTVNDIVDFVVELIEREPARDA
ncbi:MAG: hypothetical protein HYS09_06785 [Chloroflexi bacterium]|nr:hypothetical protein [Chloroflexota bacterium]